MPEAAAASFSLASPWSSQSLSEGSISTANQERSFGGAAAEALGVVAGAAAAAFGVVAGAAATDLEVGPLLLEPLERPKCLYSLLERVERSAKGQALVSIDLMKKRPSTDLMEKRTSRRHWAATAAAFCHQSLSALASRPASCARPPMSICACAEPSQWPPSMVCARTT